MKTTLYFRFREWLADNYRWAQYPRQQLIPRLPKPPFFKHAMPWEARGLLTLFGMLAVGFGSFVLAAILFVCWAAFIH